MHFLIANKLNSFKKLNKQPMQSLVKYFISLLFALLFNLIPGQLSLDHSRESRCPGLFEMPDALCENDLSLAEDYQHPYIPGETEAQLFPLKGSCS